jgi:hypothetical protein
VNQALVPRSWKGQQIVTWLGDCEGMVHPGLRVNRWFLMVYRRLCRMASVPDQPGDRYTRYRKSPGHCRLN